MLCEKTSDCISYTWLYCCRGGNDDPIKEIEKLERGDKIDLEYSNHDNVIYHLIGTSKTKTIIYV